MTEPIQLQVAQQIEQERQSQAPDQFPEWVMGGLAGDFARLYADHLESPAEHFFMAFLTCLGSVVADRLTLATEIAPQPRLYTLILGTSADDRKSTTLSKTVSFFNEAVQGFSTCWGVGSAEGLQKKLQSTGRLVLCLDEFAQFVGKTRIESSVLLPCVTTLFESNRYESQTKRTGVIIEKAYLSILAASTTETYENIFDSKFTAIGFTNRLWIVPGSGERRFSFPRKIPSLEVLTLKKRLSDLLRLVAVTPELDLTDGAKEIYHKWYISLDRSIHSKRLDTYALRLMALLAANEMRPEVDEEIVQKACALCNWQLAVRQTFDPIDADSAVARMEQKITRLLTNKGPMSDRDVKRGTNANRAGLWTYQTAMANLKRAQEVHRDPKTKQWALTD